MKVVLDRVVSRSFQTKANRPQGCILGCTLFLIFNSTLPDVICFAVGIYTNDTYSCLNSIADKVNLTAAIEMGIQTNVNRGRKSMSSFLIRTLRVNSSVYALSLKYASAKIRLTLGINYYWCSCLIFIECIVSGEFKHIIFFKLHLPKIHR